MGNYANMMIQAKNLTDKITISGEVTKNAPIEIRIIDRDKLSVFCKENKDALAFLNILSRTIDKELQVKVVFEDYVNELFEYKVKQGDFLEKKITAQSRLGQIGEIHILDESNALSTGWVDMDFDVKKVDKKMYDNPFWELKQKEAALEDIEEVTEEEIEEELDDDYEMDL